MAEQSFPMDGQNFTDSQWAITQMGRTGILGTVADNPYAVAYSNGTITVSPATTSGVAQALVNGFGHQIDATVSFPFTATGGTYLVGILFTPSPDGVTPATAALTVDVQVHLTGAGKVFLQLASVIAAQNGAPLITDTRPYFDTGWVNVPLASNWSPSGATPQYRVKNGWVTFRGTAARNADITVPTQIGTLPLGVRPSEAMSFPAGSGNASYAVVTIGTDGSITITQFSGSSRTLLFGFPPYLLN